MNAELRIDDCVLSRYFRKCDLASCTYLIFIFKFSNFSSFVKGFENTEEMKEKIQSLEEGQKMHIETQKAMLQVLKQKQIIP